MINDGWYKVEENTVTAGINVSEAGKWDVMESVAGELAEEGILPDWDCCESYMNLPHDFELLLENETVVTGEWKEKEKDYVIVEFEIV